jgi:hypothetical protein
VTAEIYPSGALKSCLLREPLSLDTPSGPLTALGDAGHIRRKGGKSLSLYPDGTLKSLHLEEQTEIRTPLGPVPAELAVWHPDGAIKRVFPRNGRLSGYWTEKDEAALAWSASLDLPLAKVRGKVISLHFYAGGGLKSLTLWPGERLSLHTPLGSLVCRVGFSLYEDGALRSCEPAAPTPLATPAGLLPAHDPEAAGIHADSNSLQFFPDGRLKALSTCCVLHLATGRGEKVIRPRVREHPLAEGEFLLSPLICRFGEGEFSVTRGTRTFVFPLGEEAILRAAPPPGFHSLSPLPLGLRDAGPANIPPGTALRLIPA